MTTKSVSVSTIIRDENGNQINENTCEGITEDDGPSVTMGFGNLPDIANCLPGDIVVRVNSVRVIPSNLVGTSVDEEAGTVTFSLMPNE